MSAEPIAVGRTIIAAQLTRGLSWVSVILELFSTGFLSILAQKGNTDPLRIMRSRVLVWISVIEFGMVTALFWKWPRRVLVPLAAVFHLGILLAMNLVS